MNPISLKPRYITIKLILDNGKFPSNNSNVKVLTCNDGRGFCATEIMIQKKGGGYAYIPCIAVIHGMLWEDCISFIVMQQKSNWNLSKNSIEVYAGNELINKDLPQLIYKGNVLEAMFTEDPVMSDGAFVITSLQGGVDQNEWSDATSISGEMSKQFILKSIIAKSSIGFTPDISPEISGYATDLVLEGNWRSQLNQFCHKFGYQFKIDNDIVRVAPQNRPFSKTSTKLSENNATCGFPKSGGSFIQIKTWFDPTLIFGQLVTLETTITTLQGEYIISGMDIHISNNGEAWYNTLSLIGQNK